MESRALNNKGSTLFERIRMGLLFTAILIVLIYTGARSHSLISQLPATFRTTTTPNRLPLAILDQLFSQVPNSAYEFPAVTICPEVGSIAGVLSCYVDRFDGQKTICDENGIYSVFVKQGNNDIECMVANERAGAILYANHPNDEMLLTITLRGTSQGSPNGVFVIADTQKGRYETREPTFDDFFAAGVGTLTQVAAKKVIHVDQNSKVTSYFEVKPSSFPIKQGNYTLGISPYILLSFRYPKLEITYEKDFLPIDGHELMAEVGGLSFILYLFGQCLLYGISLYLLNSEAFSYTKIEKFDVE